MSRPAPLARLPRAARGAVWAAVALLGGGGAVRAETPAAPPTDSVVPAAVVDAVKAAVGARWSIDPARVSLSWGPLPRGTEIAPDASVELLGTGADGWWIASITNPAGPSTAEARTRTIRTRLRAGSTQLAAVATRALPRGATLSDEDLRITETVVWGTPTAPILARPGWTVRSAVSEGTPLRPPTVDVPPVVRSGEPVEVHVARGRIALSVEAIALGTAAAGERVRVRATTGRILSGIATGPGRVKVAGDAGR